MSDERPVWLDKLGANIEELSAKLVSMADAAKKREEEEAKRREEEAKRREEEAKRREEEAKRREEEYAKWCEEVKRREEVYAKKCEEEEAKRREADADLKARISATNDTVNGIGKSNGMFAEDIYYRTLWRQKEFAGIHFDDVSNAFGGVKKLPDGRRLQDQFDIVMLNDVAAAIVESKYRARKDDVTTLVEKKVNNFKIMFPDYKDHKIYLGLAALAFEDDVVAEARKYGVGLLQQVGETVEYAADWEVKAY